MTALFQVCMSSEVAGPLVETVLSGYIGQGPRVDEFERVFSNRFAPFMELLAVNSCTSALDLALHLAGVKAGDEVITTPMTCTATNGVIVNRGAIPVWADIDRLTGIISPADVARKVTRKTKAIMAVDWGGRLCDYRELRRNMGVDGMIPVIEDAAHRLRLGTDHGDYVCWSFQAIKHLTTGDGGMLGVPFKDVDRARLLRWYGLDRRSNASFRCEQNITEAGFKYHMNDIAATIGLANLDLAEHRMQSACDNARYYQEALADLPGVQTPPWGRGGDWWLYTLIVRERDRFIACMAEQDIECSRVHARNDRHAAFHFPNGELPGVDYFDAHQVAIPVGWWVSIKERERIAQAVRDFAFCEQGVLA